MTEELENEFIVTVKSLWLISLENENIRTLKWNLILQLNSLQITKALIQSFSVKLRYRYGKHFCPETGDSVWIS